MRTHPAPHPAAAMRHAALVAIALIGLWLLLVAILPHDAARPPAPTPAHQVALAN